MTTIHIIRHAEAEGNLYRRIHGWYDARITENGWKQIEALEKRFADVPIDAAYSSDLFRTVTTARAICLPKNLPLHTNPDLRELNFGSWEDRMWSEVKQAFPDEMRRFQACDSTWQPPGGERFEDVGVRMERTVLAIAKAHPNESVAIFSHGVAIRQLLIRLNHVPPEEWCNYHHSDNTSVTTLTCDGESLSLVAEGDASHLDESLSSFARQRRFQQKMAGIEHLTVWFKPLDMKAAAAQACYLDARLEAWRAVHGEGPVFQRDAYLNDALLHSEQAEYGVSAVMLGDDFAGILQLDLERFRAERAGYIAFFYIAPHLRSRSLGDQLIGQAISLARKAGHDYLRLRCASYNHSALHFYRRNGFRKVGSDPDAAVPLNIMVKYIGYDTERILAEQAAQLADESN